MIEPEDIKTLLTPVFHRHDVAFAYLFGSVVEGNASPVSDIDIAVFVKSPDKDLFDLKLDILADICRALKRNDVDVVILNNTKNLLLLENIIRNGVLLYDTLPDLREEFEIKTQHLAIDFKTQRRAMMGI